MVKLTYKSKLRKSGQYSLSLTIPSDLIKSLGLEDEEDVYLELEEGDNKITITRK